MSSGVISVGIDLSLTGTGVAIFGAGGWSTTLIRSKGAAAASLAERAERLERIADQVLQLVPLDALAVIEQPAYSKTMGSMHDRSGLWWSIVGRLHADGVAVAEVPPSTLKKFATGAGNAGKDAVIAAVVRRFPDLDVIDNNVADAVFLAAMGARQLGHLTEQSYPANNLDSLMAVRWPDGVA